MAAITSLADAREFLAGQLEGPVAAEEWVQHVEYDPELERWYVRFGCEGRDAATIYFDLKQRSLYYELYFIPMPPPDEEGRLNTDFLEWLLRRNRSLYTVHFAIGTGGDVFLVGRTPLEDLDEARLDHILGEIYEATETWFQAAVTLAYRGGVAPRDQR